jgi:chromosome segregation ATPase
MRARALAAWTLLVAAFLAPPALAQDADRQAAREREMLRRAQQAQRQAEEARAAAEAERAKLDAELKDVKDQAQKSSNAFARERRRVKELETGLESAAAARDQLQKEKEALAARLAETERKLAETSRSLEQTSQTLAMRERDLASLRELSAKQAQANAVCEDKNRRLYEVSTELIDKFRTQGFWDAVKRKEPFTGLKQVEVENLLEEYRERADDARVAPDPVR